MGVKRFVIALYVEGAWLWSTRRNREYELKTLMSRFAQDVYGTYLFDTPIWLENPVIKDSIERERPLPTKRLFKLEITSRGTSCFKFLFSLSPSPRGLSNTPKLSRFIYHPHPTSPSINRRSVHHLLYPTDTTPRDELRAVSGTRVFPKISRPCTKGTRFPFNFF